MSEQPASNGMVQFIWSVADLLRGDYKAHEYGQVILPLTVLRRLDCVLEPTKTKVIARAAELEGKIENLERLLLRTAGQPFYNTSPLDFARLLDDAPNLARNLRTYIRGFSRGAVEVLDKYGFDNQITRLDSAGLLYPVIARFAAADLHPDRIDNHEMGYLFEDLLRKFSEMSNETAGEHFTPREVIRLMVDILLSEDDEILAGTAAVRTMFDCACGTGGMLTAGQEHLASNPEARLEVFGQELNPETWAIARSDFMIKGQDPSRIRLGNSLSDDQFAGQRFDYMIANPPFGVDWKRIRRDIKNEADNLGHSGRFGAGLPRVSDGSFLFLQHLLSKMKPAQDGGSRIAIVFSGSPLFSGPAGSGESEIRRWIIENDWLEGVVALPDQLFYNTPIPTYVWVLSNRKSRQRQGRVVLVDARSKWERMRRGLGDKRKLIGSEQIAEITRMYSDAFDPALPNPSVKIFDNEDFGYHRITIERPLRRRWEVTEDVLAEVPFLKAWLKWATPSALVSDSTLFKVQVQEAQDRLQRILTGLAGQSFTTERVLRAALASEIKEAGLDVPARVLTQVIALAAHPDENADAITGRDGETLPDPVLREEENIGFRDSPSDYLAEVVHPAWPEAWVDEARTKVGYAVPIAEYFPGPAAVGDACGVEASLAEVTELVQTLRTRLSVLSRDLPHVKADPTVSMREIAKQRTSMVPVRAGRDYGLIGVRLYGRGAFLRETVDIDTTSAPQLQPVRAGDLVYNRLFAWKQSFALIPDELDGSYASNEFPLFELVPDVHPRFVLHSLLHAEVTNMIDRQSTGATAASRNRWSEEKFRRLVIPMPSLDDQVAIAAWFDVSNDLADAVREEQRLLALLTTDTGVEHLPMDYLATPRKPGSVL